MRSLDLLPASAGLALALMAAPALAQANDGKLIDFSMTATVQMQGMAMPPQTMSRKICTAPGKFDPQALLHHGSDCKVSDYRDDGSTITFHVACAQPQAVASDGVFHRQADGGIDGSMRTTTTAAGRPVTVETTYQGKPAGSCEYKPAAK